MLGGEQSSWRLLRNESYHFEARPTGLVDNRSFRDTVLSELEKAGLQHSGATNCFVKGVIDLGHDFIRLSGATARNIK